uniref:DDE Tnp4 domain-containing protein n=1 Tax=Phytophthora ramorum TaxID=164328 RepID=H3GWB5_PHYRM
MDMMLCLTEVLVRHNTELLKARVEVHKRLLQEGWRIAMRSRHYLTTECLDPPNASAWVSLYSSASDTNFLNATSLTRQAHVVSHFDLGLVFCFYVGSMENSTLHMLFGLPPATLVRTLRKAEKALEGFAPARISFPSPAQQVRLEKLVEAREPLLKHIFGFIDGKHVMQPSNPDLQNAMYNGWLHSVFVTGTICFAADGCIIWCKHNCPGSWNDSDTSLGFRMKLLDPAVCPDPRMNAAEWDMEIMQKVYSRLNLPLLSDPAVRGLRLNNIFRLVNYRVRTVGISQIRLTFSGAMELSV